MIRYERENGWSVINNRKWNVRVAYGVLVLEDLARSLRGRGGRN